MIDPPRVQINTYKCRVCQHEWTDPWYGDPKDDCPRCNTENPVHSHEEVVVASPDAQSKIDAAFAALVQAVEQADRDEITATYLIVIGALARAGTDHMQGYEGRISQWSHDEDAAFQEIAVAVVERFGG